MWYPSQTTFTFLKVESRSSFLNPFEVRPGRSISSSDHQILHGNTTPMSNLSIKPEISTLRKYAYNAFGYCLYYFNICRWDYLINQNEPMILVCLISSSAPGKMSSLREKRRCLPITSMEDLCPELAALPSPLQDLLCSSEWHAGGYPAKLALVASMLLGEAEGDLGYRKDPASERSLACTMWLSPHQKTLWGCVNPRFREPDLLMLRFVTRSPKPGTDMVIKAHTSSSNFFQLSLVCEKSSFLLVQALVACPPTRMERGWPLCSKEADREQRPR